METRRRMSAEQRQQRRWLKMLEMDLMEGKIKTNSCIIDLIIPSEKNEQADDISNNTNYGSQ